jgi:8-oxo-dGTP pyrophosphatase MutT (NUDIX family)
MDEKTFYESLPKKRMGAGALLFDEQGKILIVNPTYRPDWLLPGGSIELDESPLIACQREVQEELGLNLQLTQPFCIDYGMRDGHKTESFQFIFRGPVLTPTEIANIALQESELSEYRFVLPNEAIPLLSTRLARLISVCLQAKEEGSTLYLENGILL